MTFSIDKKKIGIIGVAIFIIGLIVFNAYLLNKRNDTEERLAKLEKRLDNNDALWADLQKKFPQAVIDVVNSAVAQQQKQQAQQQTLPPTEASKVEPPKK